MTLFTGSAPALITPFKGEIVDFEAFGRLIDFVLREGSDAVVACATTGEGATMSQAEKYEVIRFTVERVAGRVPVIAGTGGNNTKNVIADSKKAEELGASGLLIVTPYYNKTSQHGLVAHYHAVADAVNIPIIAYNVPGRTGLNILPATMAKMAEHKNIVGIKEASGNIEQIVSLAALCPELDIYAGNDDHVLPILSVGGKGVISTIANVVPSDMHELCAAFFEGDLVRARELQFKMLPVWRAAFCEVNPVPIKTMASLLGYGNGELRLPLVPPTDEHRALLTKTMREYGLI